jgi:hypothetical protein
LQVKIIEKNQCKKEKREQMTKKEKDKEKGIKKIKIR